MMFQSLVFGKNPQHQGINLADNVQYADNELLKTTIEYGFFGLMFVFIIIYIIQKTRSKNLSTIASKYGLFSLLIFSFFSYPSEILAIKTNATILLAIISFSTKTTFEVKNRLNRGISIAILISLAFVIPQVINSKKFYTSLKHWNDASDIYRVEAYEECLVDFELAYPALKTNGKFLIQYGKALSMAQQDSLAIDVLTDAKAIANNTILYTALGDSYSEMGKYEEAEKAYQQAYLMVPNRFYPLYLLAKMYDASHQKEKAVRVSKQILEKSVKVESHAIDEIKEFAKEIINKNS